jgi:hypothetical protein
MFILSITLQSGETHEFTVKRMPRTWKSWVMQQVPYGTDFYGCSFGRRVA